MYSESFFASIRPHGQAVGLRDKLTRKLHRALPTDVQRHWRDSGCVRALFDCGTVALYVALFVLKPHLEARLRCHDPVGAHSCTT
jgi:hypothetical protein